MTSGVGAGTGLPPITAEQRRVVLHQHPDAPAGLEVHAAGLRHEVQKGDSAWAIARDYSQAYHMDISYRDVQKANAAAFADGLHPGELLKIPGLQERFDAEITSAGEHQEPVKVTVKRGDTLSSIARRMSHELMRPVTWQQLYEANRDVVGPDPNRIMPGQQLVVPGTGNEGFVIPPVPTLASMDGDVVITRQGRMLHENGTVSTNPVMYFRADMAGKTYAGATMAEAMERLGHPGGIGNDSSTSAIVQARSGAIYFVPLVGEESEFLDHTDRVLSLAFRADERNVLGVVTQADISGKLAVRRFDR